MTVPILMYTGIRALSMLLTLHQTQHLHVGRFLDLLVLRRGDTG